MIHIIKTNKWVITTSLICIFFGVLTFFTFINKSFIEFTNLNFKILISIDLILLLLFFILIIREIYTVLRNKKSAKLGAETSFRYLTFFSITTLLPSILIAVFSLFLFNVGLQKYFDNKIKLVVNNSAEVARNYIQEKRNSIEADILLMALDINNQSKLLYNNPKQFQNILGSQRLLRRIDEVHLVDSSGEIVMSNIFDPSFDFIPPPEEAFTKSLTGKPVRIFDAETNRTSALIKLDNFIDTYLYIVKFMDPSIIRHIRQTGDAISFYYSVQDRKTGIKITFGIIYVLIVTLLLFFSIVVSINFASRLTKPIINLIGASEKISSGDLNAKVPNISSDTEIEKLNENFNSMIDKLKKQQDKLLLSERHLAWESVARKLAHEIKNPLTPIQLSIDRLKEKYLDKIGNDSKNFSSYLDTINKQIKDIEHLVNEFSDFARMPKPILRKVDLNQTILRSINLNKLSEVDIKFTFKKKNLNNFVNADEEQFNRVFINLIKNSVESVNEKRNNSVDFKGKIDVDIKDDNDYIYVIISDNGLGFDHVDKTQMLTPYFTTKKKGTGLGLAIVTKILNDHNATIIFNSINMGAEIKITIPKIL
jgi:two-component system nitrogen regulation sensor histidine kinase NtrY